MNQVFVCIQERWVLLELDKLIDVIIKSLKLLHIDLAVLHIVSHGLVHSNQVFKMDPQDGDFETCTLAVHLPVVLIVSR